MNAGRSIYSAVRCTNIYLLELLQTKLHGCYLKTLVRTRERALDLLCAFFMTFMLRPSEGLKANYKLWAHDNLQSKNVNGRRQTFKSSSTSSLVGGSLKGPGTVLLISLTQTQINQHLLNEVLTKQRFS